MHTLNSGGSSEQPKLEVNADSDQGLGDKCKGNDEGQGHEQEKEKDADEESEDYSESWLKYKQESDTYYCEVCECSMNGEQTYEAHLEGARHRKNLKNRAIGAPIKKSRTKTAIGSHLAEVVDREPELMQMIKDCKEPLIGLQYVTEFCHTRPDFEPVYACNLCECKCDVRLIMKHLTGFKHRLAYMKKHYIKSAVLVQHGLRKSNQSAEAETYAADIEAKEGRQKMVVRLETDSTNGSAGLEPLDSVSSSALESRLSKSVIQRSGTSAEGRNFRKRHHDHGRSDSCREHEYSGHSRSPDWQRQRWGQSNDRYEQEYYDQHEQNHVYDEQWQDCDDNYYRHVQTFNPSAYPRPRVPCGRRLGVQTWRPPPPSMVPPVRPRVEAAGVSPYHRFPFRENSAYCPANLSEDSNEVGAISEVIAEAIRQYKLQKAQEKTANTQMPLNQF